MPIRSLRDLYFDELGGLCDVEERTGRALAELAEAARTPDLRAALNRQGDAARFHLERLQLIFTHWGEPRRPHRSESLAAILRDNDQRLHDLEGNSARDVAIIGAAHRLAHYELAVYTSARMYALRLNRTDEARLLQETIDEETRDDSRLTAMGEAVRGDDAYDRSVEVHVSSI